jgi:TonB family protein
VPAPILAVPAASPFTLEGYKKLVAGRIAVHNPEANDGPLPPMLKSIVVLEITIDRLGNPIQIAVYRSNGFRHLESRALESVVRAAPFELPAQGVLQGAGSVTFLETFLFRGDDSFQIRSLVSAPEPRG